LCLQGSLIVIECYARVLQRTPQHTPQHPKSIGLFRKRALFLQRSFVVRCILCGSLIVIECYARVHYRMAKTHRISYPDITFRKRSLNRWLSCGKWPGCITKWRIYTGYLVFTGPFLEKSPIIADQTAESDLRVMGSSCYGS